MCGGAAKVSGVGANVTAARLWFWFGGHDTSVGQAQRQIVG